MKFSIIIAIYNRKDELQELLQSLAQQTRTNFEVIVVDDGSSEDLAPVVGEFKSDLNIEYFKKENTGPGLSRNFGAGKAKGDYLIFVDSDCIVPSYYIENIEYNLTKINVDAFGGNDQAGDDFDNIQKAINYSMTSMLTTGGIRGKDKALTKFQPRSFNMGIKKNVFEEVGGFSDLRIGEDPDLSLRLWKNGFNTAFFKDIGVYHKRRNTLRSFANQVYQFGIARPILNKRHPQYKKLVFWFPTLFYLGLITSIILYFVGLIFPNFSYSFIPFNFYILYFLLIYVDASIKNKSLNVGFWSVVTSFIQLVNYGKGFLKSWWNINVLKRDPRTVFPNHYYS